MRKIADVTDHGVRRTQLLACIGSSLLLGVAGALLLAGQTLLPLAVAGSILGVAGLGVASGIRQRWVVTHLGHEIRFENSPITAERLYLDGGLVARGGVGSKVELRAPIRVGPGAGTEVVALCDAGFARVRLRLFIDGEDAVPAPVPTGPGMEPPLSPGQPSQPSPASPPVAPPVGTPVHSAAVGRIVVARRAIEFLGSLITLVTSVSAALLWLFGARG